MADELNEHLHGNRLFPDEQRGVGRDLGVRKISYSIDRQGGVQGGSGKKVKVKIHVI